jgi:branched-chain amino acid transport system substrate-binding protein
MSKKNLEKQIGDSEEINDSENILEKVNKPTDKTSSPENEKKNKKTKSKKFGCMFWILVIPLSLMIFFIVTWQNDLLPEDWISKSYSLFVKDNKPIYIAISGPMTGKGKVNGQAMVKGAQLYLDQINQQGGIQGHPVELLIFDDQNQPQQAQQKALEIAKNSEALAVIGHYTSSTSIAAAPIYQQYGVPAVSGSATADELTQNNDWYFRTIFNNNEQGAFLANYVRKVLHYNDAYILFDEDAYGSSLATTFVRNAKTIGLKVKQQWHFNSTDTFNDSLTKMIQTLSRSPNEKHLLFLATHSTEAVETTVALKHIENIQVQIVGADAVSSNNFLKKLQHYPQEQIQPGYYSDGIYTIFPLLFDIASERAQDFRYAFFKKHQDEVMITSALYYDAALVALDAIGKVLEQGQAATLLEKRRQVRDNLWQLAKVENAIEGITGSLYFDENGDAVKSIPIGVYKLGKAIAALRQFQPLQSVENADNLLQEMLENRIVEINGKFVSLAQVVYVGIDFSDISELDTKDSTFTADFYLWFRFKGEFDDSNIELVNLFEPKKYPLDEPMSVWHSSVEKGITTKTYRVKTEFKLDLDFRKFPLDQQMLSIYFRHKKLTKDKLIYVVDTQGMGFSQVNDISQSAKKFFSVGGWNVNKISFFQNTKVNDSTLGITDFFGTQRRIESSQFNANLTIHRDILSFILKALLPVIFLIVLGYVAFFISAFSSKLGIGTNLILATSLFHLKLVSELPKISYLVLIEFFFYLVYFLAIFIIIIAVLSHFYEEKEEEDEKGQKIVNRLNIIGRILYPLVLMGFVGTIVYQNYDMIMG